MADHKRNVLVYIIELLRRSHLVRYWLPVFIWMAGIFYLSSRSNPSGFLPSPGHGINIDRLAHIAEYTGLAALLYRALRKQGSKGDFSSTLPPLCTPALLALAYAILDELHQEFVPGRSFELTDIGYDLAGIIVVGLIWVRDRGRERCLQNRLPRPR